jgi:parvulin-like peptidyl-prolyl isomerase
VKSLTKIAIPAFLFVFTIFCFSLSTAKAQPASKPDSPAPASTAQPQAKTETVNAEEEEAPPVGPNAIFPKIVARIDGKPIFGRDLESIVRGELANIRSPEWKNLSEDYQGKLTYGGLSLLINSKLIYKKALSVGIKATDEEVKAELQRISKTYRSDAEMNAILAKQGLDRASLQESLRESLTVQKYMDETIEKKITVTPEEVGKFYAENPEGAKHPDMVRISMIVMLAGEADDEDALAKRRAEAVLARVKKGEDFAKLAKENSIDDSASDGGDMGYVIKKDITELEIANAAFSAAVGDAKLIKIGSKFIILKITGKKKEGISTLEEVKPQITDILKEKKFQEEKGKLINDLRDHAKIEYLIPYRTLKP